MPNRKGPRLEAVFKNSFRNILKILNECLYFYVKLTFESDNFSRLFYGFFKRFLPTNNRNFNSGFIKINS